jgi:hypothetical protein
MNKKTSKYPKEFLNYVHSVTNKRAKIMIDHILQHGFITTEDLETTYGYSHPPRAARDVREAGIPLETFKVKSQEGRSIAAYKFGDITQLQVIRVEGRKIFPKEFKKKLFDLQNSKCAVCNGEFTERYLQVDHRVPYEVGGDVTEIRDIADFMLLCKWQRSSRKTIFIDSLFSLQICKYFINRISHTYANSCFDLPLLYS